MSAAFPRGFMTWVAGAVAIAALAAAAHAQQPDGVDVFPSRPLRIVVQSGPGGPPDIRARLIATKLEARWRQPVIVENRPGASGLIALQQVAMLPADGYTMVLSGQGPFVVMPHLRKLPIDPTREFAPVTQLGVSPLLLIINPVLPARSVADLAAIGKGERGKLNATHPGPGTTNHLALTLFEQASGVSTTQVAYKDGVGQAVIDLAAGRIDLAFDSYTSHGQHLRDGRLRALAVSGPERLAVLPDVPTFSEAGLPEVGAVFIWAGFFVRAGTPAAIVDKLQRAVTGVLELPDVRASFIESGSRPIGNTAAQFAAEIKAERARYGKLIAEAGIKIE